MKVTHKAVMKMLRDRGMKIEDMCKELMKLYPEKKYGINLYNVGLLVSKLVRKGFVLAGYGDRSGKFYLTGEGKLYLKKVEGRIEE